METLSQKLREYLQDLAAQRNVVGYEAKRIGHAAIPLTEPNSERTGFYSYLDRFLLHAIQIKKHLNWYAPQSMTPRVIQDIRRHRQRGNPIERAIEQAMEIPLPDHASLLPYLLISAETRARQEYAASTHVEKLANLTKDFLFAGSNFDDIDYFAFIRGAHKGAAYEIAFREKHIDMVVSHVYLPDFFPAELRR